MCAPPSTWSFPQSSSAWPAGARRVAAGHEIGNHSLTHPCSGNFWFCPRERPRGHDAARHGARARRRLAPHRGAARRAARDVCLPLRQHLCRPRTRDHALVRAAGGRALSRGPRLPQRRDQRPAALRPEPARLGRPRSRAHALRRGSPSSARSPTAPGSSLPVHDIGAGEDVSLSVDVDALEAALGRVREGGFWVAPVVDVARRIALQRNGRGEAGMYRIGKPEIDAVARVVNSGKVFRYGIGGECDRFERRYAKSLGVKHCVMTASGTQSLAAALHGRRASGRATRCSCRPAPTWRRRSPCSSPERSRSSSTSTTRSPSAPARSKPRSGRARGRDPGAHVGPALRHGRRSCASRASAGCSWSRTPARPSAAPTRAGGSGRLGHVGAFSFNYYKNMTCGEGGAVVTSRDALAERIRCAVDCCSFYWTRAGREPRGLRRQRGARPASSRARC